MAVLETIPGIEEYIRKRVVEDRATHKVVSEELNLLFPWVSRGLSSRSIRRFCEAHNFHATSRLADTQLDMVVRSRIHKVSLQMAAGKMNIAITKFIESGQTMQIVRFMDPAGLNF